MGLPRLLLHGLNCHCVEDKAGFNQIVPPWTASKQENRWSWTQDDWGGGLECVQMIFAESCRKRPS